MQFIFHGGCSFERFKTCAKHLSKFTGTRFLYIFFSIICLAIPLMTRESYTRKSFYRKKNIANAKKELSKLVDKTESMLKTFLPQKIVKELILRQETGETNEIAHNFDCASVLFTDMKGFTKYSSTVEPHHLVFFFEQHV